MKKLIIDLKTKYPQSWQERLTALLAEQQIETGEWSGQLPDSDGALLLTDDRGHAETALAAGVACIGVETAESAPFYGPEWIVQGIENIEPGFLREAYHRFHGIPLQIAETEHLLLRESRVEDAEAFRAILERPGVRRFVPDAAPTLAAEREQLSHYIRWMYPFYGYGLWTVIEKQSGEVIGRAGLEHRSYRREEVVEIGYLIDPERQHRGYGSEAAAAVLKYASEHLEIPRVYAFIQADNHRSLRLTERLGFAEEPERQGEIRVFVYPGGSADDKVTS